MTDPSPAAVATRITAVTVYTDQAMVTRQGRLSLTGSETEVLVAGLPATLNADSIRVRGQGTVMVQIAGVRVERVFATEPVAEQVAQLTTQIEDLKQQRRQIDDQVATLEVQSQFVTNLGEKSVQRFSQALAQQQIGLGQTREFLQFLGDQYSEYKAAIAQQNQARVTVTKQLEAMERRLKQLQTARPTESLSLWVAIAPTGPGEFDLEVSYVMRQAHWRPLYDLDVTTVNQPQIRLSYLAEVQQTSGEDWLDVALTLSTAKPGLGSLPPQLDPWYIDLVRPLPAMAPQMSAPPPAGRGISRSAIPSPENYDEFSDLEALLGAAMPEEPPAIEAIDTLAAVSNQGGVVTFQVGGGSNIPSDGNPHKTKICDREYPCHLEHVAVPKRVSYTYLRATVLNPADGVTLLPGQANIFRDNTFVGQSSLQNVSPGETFKLSLGIDERLKLERQLVEREVDKNLLGNQRRITYSYRLSVTNLQEQAVQLQLQEQLPVSRNEQIKIRLSRSNPGIQPQNLGLLEWMLSLPPRAKQELSYQVVVEYPREATLTGLDI